LPGSPIHCGRGFFLSIKALALVLEENQLQLRLILFARQIRLFSLPIARCKNSLKKLEKPLARVYEINRLYQIGVAPECLRTGGGRLKSLVKSGK